MKDQFNMKLHRMAMIGDIESCLALIKDGADVNEEDSDGHTPIKNAVCLGHKDLCKILIENGANVNGGSGQVTPLHFSVANNRIEICKILLENGADVNAKDKIHGMTPLHCACFDGDDKICLILIEHKADTDIKDNYGRTPIDIIDEKYHDDSCHDMKFVREEIREARYAILLNKLLKIEHYLLKKKIADGAKKVENWERELKCEKHDRTS